MIDITYIKVIKGRNAKEDSSQINKKKNTVVRKSDDLFINTKTPSIVTGFGRKLNRVSIAYNGYFDFFPVTLYFENNGVAGR